MECGEEFKKFEDPKEEIVEHGTVDIYEVFFLLIWLLLHVLGVEPRSADPASRRVMAR